MYEYKAKQIRPMSVFKILQMNINAKTKRQECFDIRDKNHLYQFYVWVSIQAKIKRRQKCYGKQNSHCAMRIFNFLACLFFCQIQFRVVYKNNTHLIRK